MFFRKKIIYEWGFCDFFSFRSDRAVSWQLQFASKCGKFIPIRGTAGQGPGGIGGLTPLMRGALKPTGREQQWRRDR